MATRPSRPSRPDDPDADAPEWWRRSATLRRIPIIAIVLLVFLILRATHAGNTPPSIRTSCSAPSFVLSTTHVQERHPLQWSATGPPGMRYLLTVGESGLVASGGQLHALPDPGLSRDQMQAASQRMTMDGDCKQSGHFAVVIGAGTYHVRMFRLGGTTAVPTATEVDAITLTVAPR
jgi:hypothetical protein